jgi:hypothetical protein
MKFLHKNLAEGKWFKLSFIEQMANIGSEVERAILHKNKGNKENMLKSVDHTIELLYLIIEVEKTKFILKNFLD